MKTPTASPPTIDAYIATFPPKVQSILKRVRQTIREAAPGATEAIKYRMPTFVLNGGNLVHFAAYDHHVGFYPTPSGIDAFQEEIKAYKNAKGSVQFPLDQPLPYALIAKITAFRAGESLKKKVKKPTKN